jgi:RNase P subunit RPR2
MANIRIERGADPSRCPICGADYRQIIPELVKCASCGFEEKSTFGIVKEYIEQNGISTISEVSKKCGVPIRKIDNYLRSGQLEIPEGSDIFIKCKRCGIDIRFGKYCKECAAILIRDLSSAVEIKESEIGEVPRKMDGKMRFIHRE